MDGFNLYFFNIPSLLPAANCYDLNNRWNNIHVSHFEGKFMISFLIIPNKNELAISFLRFFFRFSY